MSAVTTRDASAQAIAERLIIQNDLSRLSPQERVQWYRAKCQMYGLDWRLAPFDYLNLKTGLKLYLNAVGADLLRKQQSISITNMKWEFIENICVATVEGMTPDGRTDKEIGAVSIRGIQGEALADCPMKAITKAKRRLVISMGAMGADDEVETDTSAAVASAAIIPAQEMDGPVITDSHAAPTAPVVMTHHRLTPEQQEAMFNAAVERNVGAIMPVDGEQEPSTQTWQQVIAAIVNEYNRLRALDLSAGVPQRQMPDMGVLRDRRVTPGNVIRALLALPDLDPSGEEADG